MVKVSGISFEEPISNNVAVRVEGVSKKFDRFEALKNVTFEIRRGEVLGFLGPNGAGKTTMMRILTGFFPATEGKVWIGNREISTNPYETKKKIGYLPESISIYPDMRVEEFLSFVANLKGVTARERKEHVQDRMERCGLIEVRKRLIGHLSKGYKQRVGIAQAVVGDPELIILDEPTNGLDPKQIIEIRQMIKDLAEERTLILSSHILPEVSMVCSRILIMNKGKLVASGTSDELEAGLKKALEIYVSVSGYQHKEKAHQLLSKLAGVDKVTVVEEKEDSVGFSLLVSGGDPRPEISRIFVENQIPLLELRSGRLSLEDIFMKIVLEEGGNQP